MYVFAQICYQPVILPDFHVLTISVTAMDQKLHFWPPGGETIYICFCARFIKIMQFYPLFKFEPSLAIMDQKLTMH